MRRLILWFKSPFNRKSKLLVCPTCNEITPGLVLTDIVEETDRGTAYFSEYKICGNQFHEELIEQLNDLYYKPGDIQKK